LRQEAPPSVGAPTLQLLAWISERPRTYADVMETWRSTCPRLSVWEDATIDGLARLDGPGAAQVVLTPLGEAILSTANRRAR
jgi:hypothetical protein